MSTTEILDVVDENNIVVGAATRAEIHRCGHLHRAVHVLVFDPSNRVYVQRRSFEKDCSPGLWDTSAAGHVDRGEDYACAAVRELGEELGLVPGAPLEPLFELAACSDTGGEFVRVYRCITDADVVPNPDELIDGRWVTPRELHEWIERESAMFTTSFRRIWRQYAADRSPSG